MKKTLKIIFFLFAPAVLVACAKTSTSPVTEDMQGHSRYIPDDYAFELQYPEDWVVADKNNMYEPRIRELIDAQQNEAEGLPDFSTNLVAVFFNLDNREFLRGEMRLSVYLTKDEFADREVLKQEIIDRVEERFIAEFYLADWLKYPMDIDYGGSEGLMFTLTHSENDRPRTIYHMLTKKGDYFILLAYKNTDGLHRMATTKLLETIYETIILPEERIN